MRKAPRSRCSQSRHSTFIHMPKHAKSRSESDQSCEPRRLESFSDAIADVCFQSRLRRKEICPKLLPVPCVLTVTAQLLQATRSIESRSGGPRTITRISQRFSEESLPIFITQCHACTASNTNISARTYTRLVVISPLPNPGSRLAGATASSLDYERKSIMARHYGHAHHLSSLSTVPRSKKRFVSPLGVRNSTRFRH